jgi:hypothetical protein
VAPAVRLQSAANSALSLQSLASRGTVLLGRLRGVDGPRLIFGDDLEEHIRIADEGARTARAVVDDHISRTGTGAPTAEPDPADTSMPPLPSPPIRAIEPTDVGLTSVIWCTGFGADFSWVPLPILNGRGTPAHQLGVSTACPGIVFIGLPWSGGEWISSIALENSHSGKVRANRPAGPVHPRREPAEAGSIRTGQRGAAAFQFIASAITPEQPLASGTSFQLAPPSSVPKTSPFRAAA